jgi:AcrR family transcriptional regulator
MGIKERREREQEELRQKILDAASELFAKEGYQNVSMRKIAEKIEYSPTTIYLYFKDKAELLNEICEETFANLIKEMDKIENKTDEPMMCLRKAMRAYVDFGLRHPAHYELTFTIPLAEYLGPEKHPYEGSMGQKAFDHIVRQVFKSMEAGQLKQGDVAAISQAIWASGHGLVSLLNAHENFPFVEKDTLIETSINMMLEGLKP